MKKLYINGNYLVSYDTRHPGSRVYTALRRNEDFVPSFPDSIDLKITNKCNNGCAYCHENSNPSGKSFNLERTLSVLSELPEHTEVAIGGGNIIECYDDFLKLCYYLSGKGIYPRVTINCRDLDKFIELYQNVEDTKSITGLAIGVSVESYEEYMYCVKSIQSSSCMPHMDFVFHIIVGIFPYNDLEKTIKNVRTSLFNQFKVLVLGFKQFGRAKDMEIKDLDNWRKTISNLFYSKRVKMDCVDDVTIGFDNLAIEQLNIRDLLLSSEWETYFMGQDFSHTMYIDAVNEEFAPTSRSPYEERSSWNSISLLEFFNKHKKSWN